MTGIVRTVQMVQGGHLFRAASGDPHQIDAFIVDSGFHNGPGCALCHDSWCEHCEEGRLTEPCPELGDGLFGPLGVLTETHLAWKEKTA